MKKHIPSWFTDMIEKLETKLTCPEMPRTPPASEDPDKHDGDLYVWDIKYTNIQFQVHYADGEVLIRIRDSVNIIYSEKTDDPKKVIQKAKDVKSKYLE